MTKFQYPISPLLTVQTRDVSNSGYGSKRPEFSTGGVLFSQKQACKEPRSSSSCHGQLYQPGLSIQSDRTRSRPVYEMLELQLECYTILLLFQGFLSEDDGGPAGSKFQGAK